MNSIDSQILNNRARAEAAAQSAQAAATTSQQIKDQIQQEIPDVLTFLSNTVSIVEEGDDFYSLVAFQPAEITEEIIEVEGFEFETILITQE